MAGRVAAEVFPPGEFIREELEARNWTQADLAEILGRDLRLVNQLVGGKRAITPETAKGLGQAFGTGPEFWMNLQNQYDLSRTTDAGDAVERRSRIYSKAPIKEMIKRGWLEKTDNIVVLEKQVKDFYELKSLDDEPAWPHASRKSTTYGTVNPSQWAWLFRAKKLAAAIDAGPFSHNAFPQLIVRLKALLRNPEDVRRLPRALAEAGIRFLIVEHLPGTRIDATSFWLDKRAPVVALSLRYDRIDWFWFTLLHELGHVKNKDAQDGFTLDSDLVGERGEQRAAKPECERLANSFAEEVLIPPSEIDNFIARVKPLFSKQKIQDFAARIGVHPGIVVGQLHNRGAISPAHSREMLVRVRSMVTETALTDGWGHHAPAL
jgi:HTH-type transcriptional regulator / antitoxin HigA